MMSRWSAIVLGVLLPLLAWSQAEVTWVETTHDFGTILESEGRVTCSLRLVNTGDSALTIIRVRPTCGCTAGDFPHEPIAPGDTAAITLTYYTAGRPGYFDKDVYVYTNAHPSKSIVSITGEVIGSPETLQGQYPVEVGSLRLNSLNALVGELNKGSSRLVYLKGLNTSLDSLVIDIDNSAAAVKGDVLPDTVRPGGTVAFTFLYDTRKASLWGFNSDSLRVSISPLHGNVAQTDCATVYVMAVVTEDFSQLTDRERDEAPVATIDCGERLQCGDIVGSKPVQRQFTIRNTGKRSLSIRRLWSPDPAIKASSNRSSLKKGKTATVTVTIDPRLVEGDVLNSHLTIITNDPQHPQQAVRLVGLLHETENHDE